MDINENCLLVIRKLLSNVCPSKIDVQISLGNFNFFRTPQHKFEFSIVKKAKGLTKDHGKGKLSKEFDVLCQIERKLQIKELRISELDFQAIHREYR